MDTSTKSITITDLDHKINGKIGIPKGKREKYTQLMTQALLTDGMTRQNQVRFCNVFVATGVSPVIELLKSEKGKDWHSIVVSLMKLDYFIKFSRMRLRFFMDLFYWSLYTQLPNNQKVLVYSIENIKKMEIAEKGKFRIENIGLFKGYILDRWKSNELIRLNLNDKVLLGLKNFVLHCLKEDKKDLLKNHPHLKDFFNWINWLSEKNKKAATVNAASIPVKNESVDKDKKPAGNENTEEKSGKTANKVVLTLQDVIDQFEQKIIQRNSEITMLNGEITRLKNLNEEIRKNFQNTIAKLEDDLKNEKLNSINSTKDLKNKVLVLQENLKQSEELIEEQKAKLQERDQLLKDNDIRFKNFYKQKMTALGCNLKMSVNDLKESINDLEGDEKDFIETPFEDIIHLLKKEGVDL